MSSATGAATTALRLAAGALRRNLLRSLLTAFGVLVGVAALTIVVALGEGAERAIEAALESLGTAVVDVRPYSPPEARPRPGDPPPMLTEADAHAIAREAPSVRWAAPILETLTQIISDGGNVSSRVRGTTRDFFAVREWPTAKGEIWTEAAERTNERVCVLGTTTKAELFGEEEAVGRTIRIGKHPFRVIGVLTSKGQSLWGNDRDEVVAMPIGTLRAKILPTRPGAVHTMILAATDSEATPNAEKQASAILRQRHGLAEGAPNDFRVRSLDEFRKTQQEVLYIVQLLLLVIALVSLVVGGIGVMNIMLVSVAERRQEIGIRMAIGAREGDILAQFLVEAVAVSLLGGAAGTVLAALGIATLESSLGFPMALSPVAVAVALSASLLVGTTFGFLPARGAARLDPVEAMRAE